MDGRRVVEVITKLSYMAHGQTIISRSSYLVGTRCCTHGIMKAQGSGDMDYEVEAISRSRYLGGKLECMMWQSFNDMANTCSK